MKAGRMIYDALGVTENTGFSLIGGHGHYQFPSASGKRLTSFVKYPLPSNGEVNDVEVTTANGNMNDWIKELIRSTKYQLRLLNNTSDFSKTKCKGFLMTERLDSAIPGGHRI